MLRLTRGDLLLLGGLGLITLLVWLVFSNGLDAATAEVLITVDGNPQGVYPLDQDRIITVEGRDGPTVIEIAGGRVRIVTSECSDHSWHSHWLSSRGGLICAPNRVIVEVRAGGADADGMDAITR